MSSKILSITLLALLSALASTSPVDIPAQPLSKRGLASCPNGVQPQDNNPQGLKACTLPSFNCPSVGQQKAQLDAMGADPMFLAITAQENGGANCAAGVIQIPTTNTKQGEGGSTNCGFFNNNLAAINKFCPGETCESLKSLEKAVQCQQKQIDGYGGFNTWAEVQRCGLTCKESAMCAQSGLVCADTSADYIGAINYIAGQNAAGVSKGMIGNAWVIGI